MLRRRINKFIELIQIKKNKILDYEQRKQIIDSFPEPKDSLERSYFQYRCQNYSLSTFIKALQFVVSIICFPFFIFFLGKKSKKCSNEFDAIYLTDGLGMNIIPQSLKKRYPKIIQFDYSLKLLLGKTERQVIREIFKRYWFAPYFYFKSLMKISLYAYYIEQYHPKAIIVYNEYSFTSSLLTYYCRLKEINHINVLHGEKMLNIRDVFVEYDNFFVWDEYYKNLFISMRSVPDQLVVELPEFLSSGYIHGDDTKKKYDYTYYLGMEDLPQLKKLKQNLDILRNIRENICIRLHPRYCNQDQIRRIFYNYTIENPLEITIEESLARTNAVISISSTVLFQAYLLNKTVIIDNITDQKKFAYLVNLRYIILEKPHQLLSEIVFDANKSA